LGRISLGKGVSAGIAVAVSGGLPELPALVKFAWAGSESPRFGVHFGLGLGVRLGCGLRFGF
jgi:hypothetical protein